MDSKQYSQAEGDDECRTKAAAWAWYQHGKGGSTGGVNRPVGAPVRAPAPSRFKAEAMKEQQMKAREAVAHQHPETAAFEDNWDRRGSSLFDSYELLSLSKQLDQAFTKAATTTLEHTTDLEAPKRQTKLGKMFNQGPTKSPRPVYHSEVLVQQQHQLEWRTPDVPYHRSHDFYKDGYYGTQEDDDLCDYQSGLGQHEHDNERPCNLFKNCDQPQYVGVAPAQGKPWSFRKLSRALLMLTPRPTSVSHHGDDFYSEEFLHQHHHLHHHHYQHEYHHQHEVHHHHHVHHVIHATPKMGYEAASQPPKLGTGY